MTNADSTPTQPWKQWYAPDNTSNSQQKRTFQVPACSGGNGRAQEWSDEGSPKLCKVFKKSA